MNTTLYQCLFNDIHHIPYIVNNVMLFLDYMELYSKLNFLYKYVSQFLFNSFFWLMHSVAVAICLPVVVLQFIKLKFKL